MGMRMGMVGMDLASGAQGNLLPQVATPVIADGLDAEPADENTTAITVVYGGTVPPEYDITCTENGAAIFVRYRESTDEGATWGAWSAEAEWVAEV